MDFLVLIAGFAMLIKWADSLVDWASSIAKQYGISSLVIWLTIVAFGTSAPELVVNMMSAFSGETDLAISNIIWSNISNILLILWLTSLIYPIAMPKSTVRKEIPFVIFVSAVLFWLLYDGMLSRLDSFILLIFFSIFLYYTYTIAKQPKDRAERKEEKVEWKSIEELSKIKSIIYIIWWLAWLIIWWKLIVNSAVNIATGFWLPMSFVWVTIVAIWTSLPELAASMMAAFKKNTDMAIWWIVWSNIFNTVWILWITWLINPLKWYEWMHFDLTIELLASLAILIAAFTFKKNFLVKPEWAILFIAYLSYIWYLGYSVL